MTHWIEFDNAADVAAAVADTIEDSSIHAIKQRGCFRIVLAGGTTPLSSYRMLAERDLEFEKWQVYYGDERCLPLNHAERNHQLVAGTGFLDRIQQHFIIPSELGPFNGAESYRPVVDAAVPFDMVLLGMGEDGHTASLFPGLEWDQQPAELSVIAVQAAPKPPADRISLSLACLQNCRQMMVIVTGQSKHAAVQQWLQGASLPVARV
ncbi:MAG: 6-phosphogluconolactonase, partial [Gammaproteobacteria bacterium]|nr:6-phosphogluconolactonase [Gammaproteobacteria bacterium]